MPKYLKRRKELQNALHEARISRTPEETIVRHSLGLVLTNDGLAVKELTYESSAKEESIQAKITALRLQNNGVPGAYSATPIINSILTSKLRKD